MPNLKAAKKALKQNITRKIRNLKKKRILKSLLKNFEKLINDKKVEEAKKSLPELYKKIDKNKKTGIFKKNTASRKKAKIAKMINRVNSQLLKKK